MIEEHLYETEVNTAATDLAGNFSAIFPQLDRLNFDEVSSMIFTIKPKTSRSLHTWTIPTSFLAQTFGLAMSRQAADQKNTLFRMLSSHPSFCDAGGRLFEHYAHNQLSEPGRKPLLAYSPDGKVCCIPVPAKLIAGTTTLNHIQPPHNFYWRPVNSNFEGVDAIIRSGNDVWALQYTISRTHKSATKGLIDIRALMNWKRGVAWHLVMVSSSLVDAKAAQNNQKLGNSWGWPTVVYASELPMGKFNARHEELLETILNDVRKQNLTYLIAHKFYYINRLRTQSWIKVERWMNPSEKSRGLYLAISGANFQIWRKLRPRGTLPLTASIVWP